MCSAFVPWYRGRRADAEQVAGAAEGVLGPEERDGPEAGDPGSTAWAGLRAVRGAGVEHRGQRKPFAVSPLLAAPDRPGLDSGRQLGELWIGWLDDERVPEPAALVGRRIRLGAQFFTVVDVDGGNVPYAALRAHPAARRAELEFRSATYFAERSLASAA